MATPRGARSVSPGGLGRPTAAGPARSPRPPPRAAPREPPGTPLEFYDENVLLGATLLLVLFLLLTFAPPNPLTVLLGAVVLLLLPGYGLGALLLGRPGRRFPLPAQIAIVVGLSVLYNGAVGILLLLSGVGLSALAIGLAAFPVVGLATLLQSHRHVRAPLSQLLRRARRQLGLPEFSPRQRTVAAALLAGALLTFGGIAYEATIVPPSLDSLSVAVTGVDGTVGSIPSTGAPNQTLSVELTLRSTRSVASAELTVLSERVGNSSTANVTVPWVLPLRLGAGVASSEGVAIAAGTSVTVPLSFSFPGPGSYLVVFLLTAPGALPPVSSDIVEVIR